MIQVNDEEFYSCTEIAGRLNEPELYGDDVKLLLDKWQKVFGQKSYFSDTYVQSKLYRAADKNLVRHIKYNKNNQSRTFISFSLGDLSKFLDNTTSETVLQKLGKIKNIKVVEAVV